MVVISGCLSFSPSQKLNDDGNRALGAYDYQLAIERYQASLLEAQNAGDQQGIAIAMYGLARAHGYSCNFNKSEEWFLKSIVLRETIGDSGGDYGAYLSQNILELARLYISVRDWKKAKAQFERAIPLIEKLGVGAKEPQTYANVLDDYLKALESLGNTGEAEQIKNKIEQLRSIRNVGSPGHIFRPYPTNCSHK